MSRYSSTMTLGILFGPRHEFQSATGGWVLQSITTDLDVLTDALDIILERWDVDKVLRGQGAEVVDRFDSVGGEIPRERLESLGAYERQHLSLSRYLQLPSGEMRALTISCPNGTVTGHSPHAEEMPFIVEYILRNSQARPTWRRLKYLLPLVALLLILIGYIGVLATTPLNGYAHTLILAIVAATSAGLLTWARSIKQANRWMFGSIRVRMQSRKETEAQRANRHANLRVAFITAIITAPVTIAATLITRALTGS